MLRHSHKFHMGISHIFYIFNDRISEFPVSVEAFVVSSRMSHPGTEMHLVDRHRILLVIPGLTACHPRAVRPLQMRNIRYAGSRSRSELGIICKRIRLENTLALLRLDTELI